MKNSRQPGRTFYGEQGLMYDSDATISHELYTNVRPCSQLGYNHMVGLNTGPRY
jgi:hypothetical protein